MKTASKEKTGEIKSSSKSLLEKFEWYLILIGGAGIWCFIVSLSLKWLQFPVHLHTVEVSLIYIIPIMFIYFVMKVIDYVLQ